LTQGCSPNPLVWQCRRKRARDLLARGPPTQWRVKWLLAAAVAEGRAGGFLGARCSVAHREFSGISHIRFSMGVSAKVAALHTVERDPIARASCSHAALPSKRCAARQRVQLRNGVIGGAVTELQSLIPAGDLRSSTSLLEDRHKRPLTALAPLSRSGDLADFPTDSYFS
jgi:hypothetical protein